LTNTRLDRLSVGLETDILRGSMTGIGNYCFHLVKALLNEDAGLDFHEFSHMAFRSFSLDDLVKIEQMQGKYTGGNNVPARDAFVHKLSLALRARLAGMPAARRLYRRFQANRFRRIPPGVSLDIFHAFRFVPFADLGVPVLPVVYDLSFVRHPETHPKDRLVQMERLPKVIERAHVVQTISEFSKNEIIDVYGCAPGKIIVAPPAASDIFRPLGASLTGLAIAKFDLTCKNYFFAVGTLEPRKNLRTLITAYAQLSPSARAETPLVVAGNSGWGKLDLPPATSSLTSDGSLRFLGPVSDTELRSLYEGALVLLFPSIYEGFGMPVVEALACGTEVVHAENTAMDEITKGRSFRISATDVPAWVAAMRELIQNRTTAIAGPDQRVALSQTFSWTKSAKLVMEAYKTIGRRSF
jgi:glycosyltransferase involved in cell wall biosynthesis